MNNLISKKVCVLMSTYNGDRYLRQQLDSIINQENVELEILIRDDGSNDNTHKILDEYASKGYLKWYNGKNIGAALSYIDLIHNVNSSYSFYAFADQDDYWLPNKLINAINKIKSNEKYKCVPCLYYSNVTVVNNNLDPLNIKYGPINEYNLYTQSCRNSTVGCTIVVNNSLLVCLKKYYPNKICMHDQWMHMVCLALDGEVILDKNSYILYRQHGDNVIGANQNIISKLKRCSIFNFEKKRKQQLICLLEGYGKYMNNVNYNNLNIMAHYDKKVINRLKSMFLRYNSEKIRYNLLIRISFLINSF